MLHRQSVDISGQVRSTAEWCKGQCDRKMLNITKIIDKSTTDTKRSPQTLTGNILMSRMHKSLWFMIVALPVHFLYYRCLDMTVIMIVFCCFFYLFQRKHKQAYENCCQIYRWLGFLDRSRYDM